MRRIREKEDERGNASEEQAIAIREEPSVGERGATAKSRDWALCYCKAARMQLLNDVLKRSLKLMMTHSMPLTPSPPLLRKPFRFLTPPPLTAPTPSGRPQSPRERNSNSRRRPSQFNLASQTHRLNDESKANPFHLLLSKQKTTLLTYATSYASATPH